jgi:phosphoribosylaminoimidazole (AIR) synthetase
LPPFLLLKIGFPVFKALDEPVFVSGTDGVSTKLELAVHLKKYDTLGLILLENIKCCVEILYVSMLWR